MNSWPEPYQGKNRRSTCTKTFFLTGTIEKGGRVQEYEQLPADIGNGTLKSDVQRWR